MRHLHVAAGGALTALLLHASALHADPSPAAPTTVEQPVPQAYTAEAFRNMGRYFPLADVARSTQVRPLPPGPALRGVDLDGFNAANLSTGMVILHRGQIRYEAYFQGATASSHLTSWSVAKSFTSTLLGLALADGAIKSLDDPVTHYLPELADTAYTGVTIAQALRMSSGVQFDETYANGHSDVATYMQTARAGDANSYLRTRTARAAPPGTRFNYNSSETQLLGAVVQRAIRRPLAEYLRERVWQPMGAEDDAQWTLDRKGGMEIASMGLNARLRDYARFGLLLARDGKVGDVQVLPAGWVAKATTPDMAATAYGALIPGYPLGYQFQWWCLPDGAFEAQGVFGQFIYVDPKRDLVIAKTSAWEDFWVEAKEAEFLKLIAAVTAAIDAEQRPPGTAQVRNEP